MSIKGDVTNAINDAMSDDEYIKDELSKTVDSYLEYMKRISKLAIDAFYNDYPIGSVEPDYYDRKYNLYGLTEPFNSEIKYDGYDSVTIKISYDANALNMHDNKDIIFSGPFELGYHGGPRKAVSPINNNHVLGSFQHIKSRQYYVPAPKMSPSPYELIEHYFDNYVI